MRKKHEIFSKISVKLPQTAKNEKKTRKNRLKLLFSHKLRKKHEKVSKSRKKEKKTPYIP